MLIYNSQPVLVAQQRAGADGPGRQQDLQEVPHSLAVTDLVTWLGALKTLESPHAFPPLNLHPRHVHLQSGFMAVHNLKEILYLPIIRRFCYGILRQLHTIPTRSAAVYLRLCQ